MANLAISTAQTHREQAPLFERASHVWETPEHDDWGQAVDMLAGSQHTEWRHNAELYNATGLWGGVELEGGFRPKGSGVIIFVLRMYLLRRISKLVRYEQFIVTRSDHMYLCNHPSVARPLVWVPPNAFYAPSGRSSGCRTDRHIVFPFHLATKVLSVLPWMISHPETHSLNPECVLGAFWNHSGIKIHFMRRVMYEVYRPGLDPTRWGNGKMYEYSARQEAAIKFLKGKGLPPPKYPDVAVEALRGCKLSQFNRSTLAPRRVPSRARSGVNARNSDSHPRVSAKPLL